MSIPVKVFRSTDTDAPQITGGRGDVKIVLKACLVSGYGSGEKRKEPLGWEIVAGTETADGFGCAFRPTAIDSAKNIIQISGVNTTSTSLVAYFDTDESGALVNASPAMPNLATWHSGGCEWLLVGHHKSFILVIRPLASLLANEPAGAQGSALFFGELTDRVNNARANTLLMRFGSGSPLYILNAFGGITDLWAGKYSFISASVDGNTKWATAIPNSLFKTLIAGYSPINSECIYTKLAISQGGAFRGYLPFGYSVHHRLAGSENFTQKIIDGKKHLLCNLTPGSTVLSTWGENSMFYLINLEEWDA